MVGGCTGGGTTKGSRVNPTVSQVREALDAHDAERLAALFTPDYRSEQPAHPNRAYGGSDTLTSIWGDLFRTVPDLRSEVVAEVDDGSRVWVEWRWHGHYTDGSLFEMRGVAIMQLTDDGLVGGQRLYFEPVEQDGPGILEAERQLREPAR
jgi:predicted SnoaL-like aldol condensation-catalyzing enzyme